uniref:Uncharacterized protein n=1 Tax=Myoviridae sp. ctCo31 TaxID=2825053 RepID=A0A8S5UMQ4_9CAUD|nr:MAG TPA: hypothetical protein [Myoviridae sp. ctCo31]
MDRRYRSFNYNECANIFRRCVPNFIENDWPKNCARRIDNTARDV